MGTRQGMENRLVAEAGYPMVRVDMSGVRGKGSLAWLVLPVRWRGALAIAASPSSASAPTWCSRWAATWRSPAG